ncbi:hypothetical protein BJ165DRAFT_837048 [Panaeolus papilionaceus]|nr:hypothetical protein BJ165DRAFT_837048 [Panaeolus papilionaceus]
MMLVAFSLHMSVLFLLNFLPPKNFICFPTNDTLSVPNSPIIVSTHSRERCPTPYHAHYLGRLSDPASSSRPRLQLSLKLICLPSLHTYSSLHASASLVALLGYRSSPPAHSMLFISIILNRTLLLPHYYYSHIHHPPPSPTIQPSPRFVTHTLYSYQDSVLRLCSC